MKKCALEKANVQWTCTDLCIMREIEEREEGEDCSYNSNLAVPAECYLHNMWRLSYSNPTRINLWFEICEVMTARELIIEGSCSEEIVLRSILSVSFTDALIFFSLM